MNPIRRFLLALGASMLFAGLANAHDDKRAAPAKVDYSKAEEMPFGIAADPKRGPALFASKWPTPCASLRPSSR